MKRTQICYVALGLLASAMSPAFAADDGGCASPAVRSQLRRMTISHMQSDQILNDMVDLDQAEFSLSQVRTMNKPDGTVACTALATLLVTYGAGLRRTIDNNVAYDLRRDGEDQHLAVKLHKFATAF